MMAQDAGASKKTNLRYNCVFGRSQIVNLVIEILNIFISYLWKISQVENNARNFLQNRIHAPVNACNPVCALPKINA